MKVHYSQDHEDKTLHVDVGLSTTHVFVVSPNVSVLGYPELIG